MDSSFARDFRGSQRIKGELVKSGRSQVTLSRLPPISTAPSTITRVSASGNGPLDAEMFSGAWKCSTVKGGKEVGEFRW